MKCFPVRIDQVKSVLERDINLYIYIFNIFVRPIILIRPNHNYNDMGNTGYHDMSMKHYVRAIGSGSRTFLGKA